MNKPSIIRKIYNYIIALVKRSASGYENTSQRVYWKRISICNYCEHLDKQHMECTVCGCPVLTKTKWASESCPINKW